jgi:hypothetical protein
MFPTAITGTPAERMRKSPVSNNILRADITSPYSHDRGRRRLCMASIS